MYDIIIIGAGPAGLTAALYARRAEKSVLVIEKNTFGGQITHSPRVENYPGFITMSGTEFADKLVEQVLSQGADIELETVTDIEGSAGNYTINCENTSYLGKSVIIATGSHHRQLCVPGEEKFVGEGVSYCAVCDGAFYRGKNVAIAGGGNTALQEAVMLSDICSQVTIVQNLAFLTGEQKLVDEVMARENVNIILSATVSAVLGDDEFSGLLLNIEGKEEILSCDGVFVATGQIPENEPFKEVVALDERGYIISGEECLPKTEKAGIFVAGDCRTKAIRQVTTASADGAVSAIAACKFLDSLK